MSASGPPPQSVGADEFVEAVWTASEGMPFSVVELARSGSADGPLSAASLLPAGPVGRRRSHALAAAAIIGSTFDTDEFLELTGLPGGAGLRRLDRRRPDTGCWSEPTPAIASGTHCCAMPAGQAPARRSSTRLHRQAAQPPCRHLDRSPARIGSPPGRGRRSRSAAVPWMLRSAETSAAARVPTATPWQHWTPCRPRAEGSDLSRLLSLRADLLLAVPTRAPSTPTARRWRKPPIRPTGPGCGRDWPGRPRSPTTWTPPRSRWTGWSPTAPRTTRSYCWPGGHWRFRRATRKRMEAAASEMRRRVALGRPDEWQMFELVALQGFAAHNRGEWFQRLALELRRGRSAPCARCADLRRASLRRGVRAVRSDAAPTR